MKQDPELEDVPVRDENSHRSVTYVKSSPGIVKVPSESDNERKSNKSKVESSKVVTRSILG